MTNKTLLQQANELFRAGNYKHAHDIYEQLSINPQLSKICTFNMLLCTTKDKPIVNTIPTIQVAYSKQIHKINDINEAKQIIIESGLFDIDWYNQTYGDVYRKKVDPILHYLKNGAKEGRNPSNNFDTKWYVREHNLTSLDLSKVENNPLIHYINIGKSNNLLTMAPIPKLGQWWSQNFKTSESKYNLFSLDLLNNIIPPTIIVPVYNAPDEVEDCIESVLKHTLMPHRLLIINDCSPDGRVNELLAKYENMPNIEICHNEENLGFTRTVNKGICLAGESDVVFLNSDTKVTPNWLRNMMLAAYSEHNIGTVTATSNNSGAFSVPEVGTNEIPAWIDLDDYARAITQISGRFYPRVPTGNGFCLYVKRSCIKDVGVLDKYAFPKGYGEENDFCMRAGRNGWLNIIDDATYIYHVRSASFGDSKTELMKQGSKVINERYPEYTDKIKIFKTSVELQEVRQRVKSISNIENVGLLIKPRVLYVLSTRTGGTPQTNQDLMNALDDRIETFVLRCNSNVIEFIFYKNGYYHELEIYKLKFPIKAFPHRSHEYDEVVTQWLIKYSIELVHIRHIAWHSLGLVDIIKTIGLKIVFSFHDFYAVCPTVNLIDGSGKYCFGKCTNISSDCGIVLWNDVSVPLRNDAIYLWQDSFNSVLRKCDYFITTSGSVKQMVLQTYDSLHKIPFTVIPHGRDFKVLCNYSDGIQSNTVLRILFPGNISVNKGGEIILELAKLSKQINLEVHIAGNVSGSNNLRSELQKFAVMHGTYERDKFHELVNQVKPHLGGVFSICPETFCHTLSELWSCGIPVIGFDIGAVGDRIRESNAGWLVQDFSSDAVIKLLERISNNLTEYNSARVNVLNWQQTSAVINDCSYMGNKYFDVYCSLMVRS